MLKKQYEIEINDLRLELTKANYLTKNNNKSTNNLDSKELIEKNQNNELNILKSELININKLIET